MKKVFSTPEIEFIKTHYPQHGAAWVAGKLGKEKGQIKNFATRNKITRINYRNRWTAWQLKKLRAEFPHRQTKDIASELGFTYSSVCCKASAIGLKKTAEHLSKNGGRLLGNSGVATRFKKGHVPVNKGKKMPKELYEKIKHTFFQPGQLPATTIHFGKPYLYERTKKNGYVEKIWWIQESPNKRSAYLAYLCRQNNIDLSGKKPRLKPGFDHYRPPTMEDIIIVTNAENMQLNSMHRYPEELVKLIQIKGAFSRQINKIKTNE